MSINKKTLSLSIIMVFVVSLVMVIGFKKYFVKTDHSAKTYQFKMQNMFSLNHPITAAINQMAEDVKKKSNGQIAVQVLTSGAIVKGPSIFESVSLGSIDMGTTCSAYHSGILPMAATAFALPGDPRGLQEIMDFIYQDEILAFFRNAYATQNVFYGAPLVMDGYTIVSKKPINTWADLKKMKVRASGSIAKTLQKMDIPTVFIPFSEIYVALSRGTIDAEISGNHAESFLAKTYEVAKYQTVPYISGAQNCEVIINQDRWNELPENLKVIFEKALRDCSTQVGVLFNAENKAVMEKMTAQGAQFIQLPDEVMSRWIKTAVKMWDEEFTKDELSAEYIALVKKDLKALGYDL
ncbi:TRAP transporter substrate-binding protein [Desulfobacula toluolica]|uniref:DctP: TRAP dicarboxylate transporter periplasmic binding protein, DctP subunit n=1 Tax=Desulfobacula toluolica (strain DSM 7467 / Tol2) TaxID=651182 RepID=K0NF54_DESTT|nr:TRAP transporter substrate-binding protein [Desulfobacula toluolica]CCK78298.1 DctP: TRAP dicarboxylate transporter periplasmic binding protein, DctP subunit [Desulfobacula toluolica Tol2]